MNGQSFIPIARVQITEEEIAEVSATLRSGWLTTGPRARELEERFRQYLGCKHALVVNSGTAALHLAASAIGLGPGDEMITTPLTFAATANAALFVGATPILADVDEGTLNLSPQAAEAKIGPRTRAISVVHFGGLPVDMEAFKSICKRYHLHLIEDACHAIGASYSGTKIGAHSRAACFSFHPVKNMTTSEGGLLVTDDDEVERLGRLRSWHGIDKNALRRYEQGGSWYYEVQDLGFKYNMTDIQAAIGLVQLKRLDIANQERREIAAQFDEAFADLDGLRLSRPLQDRVHARHLYWVVLDSSRFDRNRFIAELTARNVGSGVHYIPLHLHPYYQRRLGWSPGMCPVAERAYEGLVSLPLWHGMSANDRSRIVEAVPRALKESRK